MPSLLLQLVKIFIVKKPCNSCAQNGRMENSVKTFVMTKFKYFLSLILDPIIYLFIPIVFFIDYLNLKTKWYFIALVIFFLKDKILWILKQKS